MPELPEVETTRRDIAPLLTGRRVTAVRVREPRLRWPVSPGLASGLGGERIVSVGRRAKFLLLGTAAGHLILHLGMSGSLRVVAPDVPPDKHDHLDVVVEGGLVLRLRDPRRFGAALWTTGAVEDHPLLRHLGPEPLAAGFDGEWLYRASRARRLAVKAFLMNGRVVAGVGNIYASETLYLAGVHPLRAAGRISHERYRRLAAAVRRVLEEAISAHGTTLRDYRDGNGRPGEFARRLRVYARAGEPCGRCATPIRARVIGQRSTYYCPRCQR